MRDTRNLFPETTCKPDSWTTIKKYAATPQQIDALLSKPVVAMSGKFPMNVVLPDGSADSYEFLGTHDGLVYYVNTEGYNYPRYMAQITNVALDRLKK